MVDGTTDVGNFHVKVKQEQYENAVEQSSFEVLIKRIIKINTSLDAIVEYQKYERDMENLYRTMQESLGSSLFKMTCVEIILVIASASYSVWSLRKFFVKKNIN